MSALVDYGSSDDELSNAPPATTQRVTAAPEVSLEDPMTHRHTALVKSTASSITTNLTYEQLTAPAAGPANPFTSADPTTRKRKNVPTGYAEQAAISDSTFRAQHRTFNSLGYAANPGRENGAGNMFVGNLEAAQQFDGKDVVMMRPTRAQREALKRKRQRKGDASVLDGDDAYKGPWAKYNDQPMDTRSDEEAEEYEEEEEEVYTAPVSNPIVEKAGKEYLGVNTGGVGKEETTFHGDEEYDYQGRTYMHVPQDLDIDLKKEVGSTTNYIPKKLVHTWKGHTKPITALRFFPEHGHLLLSAAADSKVKVCCQPQYPVFFRLLTLLDLGCLPPTLPPSYILRSLQGCH